jgi:hypothetical protein
MPGAGAWPYFPEQCPHCAYFEALQQPRVDDSGYETMGFCRHPRIAMELFRLKKLEPFKSDRCPMFVAMTGKHGHSETGTR